MLLWASVFFFIFVICFSSQILILSIHAQIQLFRLFVKKKSKKHGESEQQQQQLDEIYRTDCIAASARSRVSSWPITQKADCSAVPLNSTVHALHTVWRACHTIFIARSPCALREKIAEPKWARRQKNLRCLLRTHSSFHLGRR